MIPNHSRSKSTSIDEEVFENTEANGNVSVDIERKSTTSRLEFKILEVCNNIFFKSSLNTLTITVQILIASNIRIL